MMPNESKRPVTLEDILRLKRTERPPAEFWTQFDRELRAKQLAALVEKRPWWRTVSLSQMFAGMRRHHMLLGATGALAVTFFSVREYRAPTAAPISSGAPMAAMVAPTRSEAVAAPAVSSSIVKNATTSTSVVKAEAPKPVSSAAMVASAPVPAAVASGPSTSAPVANGPVGVQLAGMILAPVAVDDSAESIGSSAYLVAGSLVAIPADDGALSAQLLSSAHGFETRGVVARNRPVEPLAQMKVPSGSRRSNLITSATLVSTTGPVVTGDHAARSLSDERLYETVSRVNARGAGMLVKF